MSTYYGKIYVRGTFGEQSDGSSPQADTKQLTSSVSGASKIATHFPLGSATITEATLTLPGSTSVDQLIIHNRSTTANLLVRWYSKLGTHTFDNTPVSCVSIAAAVGATQILSTTEPAFSFLTDRALNAQVGQYIEYAVSGSPVPYAWYRVEGISATELTLYTTGIGAGALADDLVLNSYSYNTAIINPGETLVLSNVYLAASYYPTIQASATCEYELFAVGE